MNLRWLWFDVLDPGFRLTRAQRRAITVRARQMIFRNRAIFTLGATETLPVRRPGPLLTMLSAMTQTMLVIALVLSLVALTAFSRNNFAAATIVAALAAAIYVCSAGVNLVCARPWRRLAMYELGYPICAQCGYALQGTEESKRCPECGWWKSHPNDLPRVDWTDDDRAALREHGYDACEQCGGLISARETQCRRCGDRVPASQGLP